MKLFKPVMSYTTAYIGEDLGLLDVNTGKYYVLNPIGAEIWELISEKPRTIEEIVTVLEDTYEGGHEDILRDTLDYLNNLVEKGLILTES